MMAKLPLFFLFSGLALSALCPGLSAPRKAQAVGAGDAGQSYYLCEEIKKPFFAEAGKGEFNAQRIMALPEKFSMPKPAGVKRVFILGESVATLLGPGILVLYGDAAGARLLRQRFKAGVLTPEQALTALRQISKTASFAGEGNAGLEIINCGMGAYESVRIYGILREVLRYSPDLLVVLSGNHEGSPGYPCPGLSFKLRRIESRLLERYYSLSCDPRQAEEKASLKMHGEMLRKMAGAAKKAGVPVVFCTLPVNVRDMPSLTPLSFENVLFASGYKLFYDKEYKASLEKFRLGLAADPNDTFLNFYTAKTLEKIGRTREAGPYYLKAVDADNDMTRATPARNDLIRRVAGSEGACVADLEKLFYKLSPGGLPGFSEFTDGVHWRSSYNKAVWDDIFRSATACGIKGFERFKAADSRESPREDALRRLSYVLSWINPKTRLRDENGFNEGALAELSFIRRNLPGLLQEAAVSSEKLDKLLIRNYWSAGMRVNVFFPLFLAHLAETERRLGNYGTAMTLCERALSLEPGDGYFRLLRAQILAGLRRRKEAEK